MAEFDFIESIVRVYLDENDPAPEGTGFLISGEGHVLTCAHVVYNLVNQGKTEVPCKMQVGDKLESFIADITHHEPVSAADIALLKLRTIPKAAPLTLTHSKSLKGKKFEAHGFDGALKDGSRTQASILYYNQGTSDENSDGIDYLELTDANDITRGYSGGPVVVENRFAAGVLVGIAQADDNNRRTEKAYAIPTELIIEKIPELEKWVKTISKQTDPAQTSGKISPATAALCDRQTQRLKLHKSVDLNIKQADSKRNPVFYIALGNPEDLMETLTDTFRFLVTDHTQNAIKQVVVAEWPENNSLDAAKNDLIEWLGYNFFDEYRPNIEANDLLKFIKNPMEEVLMIRHLIAPDEWTTTQEKLIQWYLEEYWRKIDDNNKVSAHIFLDITYPEKKEKKGFLSGLFGKKDQEEELLKFLERFVEQLQSQQVQAYLLAPLGLISYNDLDRWRQSLSDQTPPVELIDDIFEDKQEELPMRKVYPMLKKKLLNLLSS